uniref:CKLF-like MARVEL transmembrane domain-containing protein 6 n=1 Tax=Theropithecus gelada TaxID=9565 RepID=A0A8D2G7Z1_THEGE
MENGAVYSPTTEEDPGPARGPRSGLAAYFFLGRLPRLRRVLKGLKLLLSLLAFICEVVSQCTLWGTLFFLIKSSYFYITLGTGCVFLLASKIFVSTHDRTSAEIAAVVFGFIASFMFLLDFVTMLYEKRQESQLRRPGNSTRAEALTEPLNA